jgi:SAM-dependent methyltransferase
VTERGRNPYKQSRTGAEDGRLFSAASARNREPLLDVLRGVLPGAGLVLEIGSGTGEHAVFLAGQLPDLVFQPSDPDPEGRESIAAWTRHAGVTNVLPPLDLDSERFSAEELGPKAADLCALMAVNVIHISPWATALGLLRLAGELLPADGPLILYGPFRRNGSHTAPSNQEFDSMLRARDPAWGVRSLEDVSAAASERNLVLEDCIEMPANNLVVVLRRRD